MRLILIASAFAVSACSPATDKASLAPTAQTGPATAAAPAIDPLTDRLWALTPGDGRLGAIRVFLSNGAMMQGSCVETYRISEWRRDGAGKVAWNEDGIEISADIISVNASSLTLGLNLRDGQKIETYAPAAAPFVCPDLPR